MVLPVQNVPMPMYGGLFASAKCPHATKKFFKKRGRHKKNLAINAWDVGLDILDEKEGGAVLCCYNGGWSLERQFTDVFIALLRSVDTEDSGRKDDWPFYTRGNGRRNHCGTFLPNNFFQP